MRYHNFENWLVANGETWAKYVCGNLGYKIKMHRRYALYLEAIEIKEKKTDSPASKNQSK
ncbi:MAG TPA: hypothetical protein DIC43_06130 [Vagococcus sp.]|nr:hypothetical protein [Vagococcus sp.]